MAYPSLCLTACGRINYVFFRPCWLPVSPQRPNVGEAGFRVYASKINEWLLQMSIGQTADMTVNSEFFSIPCTSVTMSKFLPDSLMPKILNIASCPTEFIDDPDFRTSMKTVSLGAAAGSERLYVNIDYVKPGASSAKFHSHSLQEEFFLILKGSGTLRINNERKPVRTGDFIAKPAGKRIAHQFINTGTEILEILDCGTKVSGDIVTYPDENVVLNKDTDVASRDGVEISDWTSEPG